MKMARKLKDRLGMVAQPAQAEEPMVTVPDADKARSLVEAAESGFAAVTALYADRNKSVELAQSLHRHNVYLLNINNDLRARLQHAQMKSDHYMRLNARVGAWVAQAYDLLGRISGEVGHCEAIVDHMPTPPVATNNPEAPPLDANGIPVIEAAFDTQGMPIPENGPPEIDAEQIRLVIASLEKRAAAE